MKKKTNLKVVMFIILFILFIVGLEIPCIILCAKINYDNGYAEGWHDGFSYSESFYARRNSTDYNCVITYTGEEITNCRCAESWVWWNHG